jgi:hypothetical protein
LLINTIFEPDFIEFKKTNGSNLGRLNAINITSTLIEFKKCFESLKLSKHDNIEKDVCFSISILRISKFSGSWSIIIQFVINFEK